jgi:hypothetical protein
MTEEENMQDPVREKTPALKAVPENLETENATASDINDKVATDNREVHHYPELPTKAKRRISRNIFWNF